MPTKAPEGRFWANDEQRAAIAWPLEGISMPEFVHPMLGEDVTSISGHYALTHERTLRYAGKEVLYFVGYAVCDTSCCGAGGWGYALVAGVLLSLRVAKDASGRWVSRVEPILDEAEKKEIAQKIAKETGVSQVVFR